MPIVDLVAIPCKKCEKGFMYKSTLEDNNGSPAAFALVYSYHMDSIVFQGLCDFCGQEFRMSWILDSMLHYRRVDP